MMGSGPNAWFGMGGGVFVVIVVLLVVLGVGVWAVLALTRGAKSNTNPIVTESPRQILDRRLAAGEIDQEQYVQLLHLLGRPSAQPPSR